MQVIFVVLGLVGAVACVDTTPTPPVVVLAPNKLALVEKDELTLTCTGATVDANNVLTFSVGGNVVYDGANATKNDKDYTFNPATKALSTKNVGAGFQNLQCKIGKTFSEPILVIPWVSKIVFDLGTKEIKEKTKFTATCTVKVVPDLPLYAVDFRKDNKEFSTFSTSATTIAGKPAIAWTFAAKGNAPGVTAVSGSMKTETNVFSTEIEPKGKEAAGKYRCEVSVAADALKKKMSVVVPSLEVDAKSSATAAAVSSLLMFVLVPIVAHLSYF